MGFLDKGSVVKGNSLGGNSGNFNSKMPEKKAFGQKSSTNQQKPSSPFAVKRPGQEDKPPVNTERVFGKSLLSNKKEEEKAFFHGQTMWGRNINKALKKMEYKEKWNSNPLTKMGHDDFEKLKKVLNDPKYAGGGISEAELKMEQKKWNSELKAEGKKLNPFDAKDFAKIKAQRRQVKFFNKLQGK